jgi:hypothetical protein
MTTINKMAASVAHPIAQPLGWVQSVVRCVVL